MPEYININPYRTASMRISLSSQTAQRIREALGDDVDLAPELVPGVLARLAVEAPAVYSQVLVELSGSQIRLDSEDQLRRRQRRGTLRRLLFSWGEYETGVGDRLFAKRHIAAAVPLSIAALTLTLLAISLAIGHRTTSGSAERPAGTPPRRDPALAIVSRPPVVPQEEVLRELGASSARSLGHLSFAGTLPPARPGLADTSEFAPRFPGNPVVVSIQESAQREAGPRGGSSPGAISPVVYNRATDREGAQIETANHPTPAVSPPPLAPGTRIPGTLVTGVVVVPGGSPMPVVVETANPTDVWIGQAVLGPADRVQVTVALTARSRGDSIRGVALDPEHLIPGVPGRTTVRHASTAASMAAAALGAASDYAQAAARQGSVIFPEWWGLGVSGQVPPAWTYLATRVSQEFGAKGTTTGGWVMTTEIPAGTPIIILVTGVP
jgi:hypothetical protein